MAVTINASNSTGVAITSDTSGIVQFQSSGANTAVIDASGNVGIGTTSPSASLDVNGVITSNRYAAIGALALQRANGTISAPTAISGSTTISRFNFNAYDGTNYQSVANIFVSTDGAVSSTAYPGFMTFYTAGATGGGVERMRIDSSGNVLVTNPAGLGYGTGSGGTVTQATSKTTGVTLNKPTGQITMAASALGAGASAKFVFTNSFIAATDILAINSGTGFGGSYRMHVNNVLSGAANVEVVNISAGSLSDAVLINFAIIKGATA